MLFRFGKMLMPLNVYFNSIKKVKQCSLLFVLLLLIYTVLRAFFHATYFSSGLKESYLQIYYWGFRMDFAIIFYINFPFLVYYFLIHDFLFPRLAKFLAVTLLGIINIPMLSLNFFDVAYYKFVLRRSNADLIYVLEDSFQAVSGQWLTYWWLIVSFFLVSSLFIWCSASLLRAPVRLRTGKEKSVQIVCNTTALFFVSVIGGLTARGTAEKPIMPSTSHLYFPAPLQPLVCNSAFSFLYSLWKGEKTLNRKHYLSETQLDLEFSHFRKYDSRIFTPLNVVVFVMESVSAEYLDNGDPLKARTPFMDSLMNKSIVCTNAFANGLESNQGLVATLASIPSFFHLPYYYSAYSNNAFRGLGTILKEQGFETNFFMGAEEDHFGFKKLTRMVGIDDYISAADYNNDMDHNGLWGISDHKFLPFAARVIKNQTKPSLSVVFNLSTHHPYVIPSDFESGMAGDEQSKAQKSIMYFDQSLKMFFDEIKSASWYNNTLFVFCSDHSSGNEMGKGLHPVNIFRIPLFFHIPGMVGRENVNIPVQQLDVVPTILDLMNYPKPFMAFGKSIFDSTDRYVFERFFDNYQILDDTWLLGYNEGQEHAKFLYDYRSDPDLQNNVLEMPENREVRGRMTLKLRAFLQRYTNSLIENRLYVK